MRKIEDTLNGGYRGLYGEVVTCDMYKLRKLPFKPDIIYDIGANIGVFTRYARELFPQALIIAVEPHPENIADFKEFTPKDSQIQLMECAMGRGPVFRGLGACNGSGENYLSAGLGYSIENLSHCASVMGSSVQSVPLQGIVKPATPGTKVAMKIDCEGAENILWQDSEAMDLLRAMDYVTIELHYYSLTAQDREEVVQQTNQALDSFRATHHCASAPNYFWALSKKYDNTISE